MKHLDGKIALVTGASRGIGRASALALAREGAHVVIAARTTEDLKSLSVEIHEHEVKALAVTADITQAADVERLKQAALDEFGQVDILLNNVGVSKYGTLDTINLEDYDWMMNTNMRSSFLCTKAFLPDMLARESGYVIFLGSVAGLRGFPGEAVYNATKFAQYGFAQALDHETREKGVKVCYVAPGGVNTHFALGTGREPGADYLDDMLEPETVAEAVVFACTQPPKSRVFLIGMRPMSEPL